MKGAFFESKGSVWKKGKIEQQLEILCFFRFSEKKFILFSKSFCNDDFPNAFRVSRKIFDDIWRELIFFFFLFWTLTVRFLHFVQETFKMSETFSAVPPKLFDRHVRRAFYASIQTLRNLLSDIEKDSGTNRKKSKTSKIFVTWEKNLGSTVFRQGCWNCNLCVHLNNLKPSEFKTLANFFGTMSKKLFRLRKTLLAVIFKTAFFSTGESFE